MEMPGLERQHVFGIMVLHLLHLHTGEDREVRVERGLVVDLLIQH